MQSESLIAIENLIPGKIGFAFVLMAMVSAIFSVLSYYAATESKQENESRSWLTLGRIGFLIHSISVIGIVVCLYYILSHHLFEYQYAWQHSSRSLPKEYLISCFWEGQEGSFLLWTVWQVILGLVLLFTSKQWEAPTMAMVAMVQVFLISMILGINIGSQHIGSSPFILTKDFMSEAPIFKSPNYMQFLQDGNGLNPLLQNYWMVIHPPTLFLGFASTLIPFAFAFAALWKRDYTSWIKPVLPWLLFSGGILGTGVLMGGAWAYEALTFGGFWAWDPVENASLVPWITLVAGLHTLLAYKSTGYSLRITFILLILTFVLVLYSTFLTRSGILGDSSVHSFTDLGMQGQLVIYMAFFSLFAIALLALNWKQIPDKSKEESSYSREFWLFIAALVFCISAFQITFDTSREVINKLFGTNLAKPIDAISHFNRWQIWISCLIAFGSAFVQFLKYKQEKIQQVLQKQIIYIAISLIIAVVLYFVWQLQDWKKAMLLLFALYAIVANSVYIAKHIKGKILQSGASMAHIGFALILVGILVSAGTKKVISENTEFSTEDRGADKQNTGSNIILFKNNEVLMNGYYVTYLGDSVVPPNFYYKVKYVKKDTNKNKILENFMLYPSAQINEKMGFIGSPSTAHYWNKDIYTHVTSVPDRKAEQEEKDLSKLDTLLLGVGDTAQTGWGKILLNGIDPNPSNPMYIAMPNDIAFGANLEMITTEKNKSYQTQALYFIRNNKPESLISTINEVGMQFEIIEVLPDIKKIKIALKKIAPDYITLKAIVFPYINILWLGCFIMVFGFFISMYKRWKIG